MAKQFKADKSLMDYLKIIGFQFVVTQGRPRYFVNKKGNQIRINLDEKEIVFLNRGGFVVGKFKEVTDEQISNFSKLEYNPQDYKKEAA